MKTAVLVGAVIGFIVPGLFGLASQLGYMFGPATIVAWPSVALLFAASDVVSANQHLLWAEAWLLNIVWYSLLGAVAGLIRCMLSSSHA